MTTTFFTSYLSSFFPTPFLSLSSFYGLFFFFLLSSSFIGEGLSSFFLFDFFFPSFLFFGGVSGEFDTRAGKGFLPFFFTGFGEGEGSGDGVFYLFTLLFGLVIFLSSSSASVLLSFSLRFLPLTGETVFSSFFFSSYRACLRVLIIQIL